MHDQIHWNPRDWREEEEGHLVRLDRLATHHALVALALQLLDEAICKQRDGAIHASRSHAPRREWKESSLRETGPLGCSLRDGWKGTACTLNSEKGVENRAHEKGERIDHSLEGREEGAGQFACA